MIETECYIDNSDGVYSDATILELLGNIAEEVGAEVDWQKIRDVQSVPSFDRAQFSHELESEIIDQINTSLPDDLILAVGEVDPGVYLIRKLEDE